MSETYDAVIEVREAIKRAMEEQRSLDYLILQERITQAEYERAKAAAVNQALGELSWLEPTSGA